MKFENRYYTSDEMLRAYIRKVICKNIFRAGIAFSALSALMLLITCMGKDYVFAAVFGVCLIVLLSVVLFTPMLTLRQVKESNTRLHNGKECETVVGFGDRITMQEGTVSLTVEYSQIQRIVELPAVCVLMIGKQNAVLVDPAGFSVGTYPAFLEFIREKTGIQK